MRDQLRAVFAVIQAQKLLLTKIHANNHIKMRKHLKGFEHVKNRNNHFFISENYTNTEIIILCYTVTCSNSEQYIRILRDFRTM